MAQHRTLTAYNQHLVVLVCDKPHSRIAKIGYGLKTLGCYVVLLHRDALCIENQAKCFDETHSYHTSEEALSLARRFRPLVYHLFSSWDFDTAACVMSGKPGHVVFDDYDVISGVVRPDFIAANFSTILETERFCLEKADGITCRDLLLQSAKRNSTYRIQGKKLYLPDCCWGDSGADILWEKSLDVDSLHLVYAGNMAIEKNATTPHARDNFYLLDFARDITAEGIHLHIFPSTNFANDFENILSDHLELAAKNSFYHVNRPMPADKLIQEISKYDLGLLSMWKDNLHTNRAYLPVIFRDSTSNKLFDYMDAGLGIVSCDAFRFQRWFLRHHKICISAYLEEVKEAILSSPVSFWRGLRKRTFQARNSFLATLHAIRLLIFYESVATRHHTSAYSLPAEGEHLAVAQDALQQGDIDKAVLETELELFHFPGQPSAQRFMSFLRAYIHKLERMN